MAETHERRIEVMDTTLRDGEQTPEIAYTPAEKLQIARMLLANVGVDRVEIAGTRVSEGEHEAARLITRWARGARMLRRVEMLGYCDGKASVDWITSAGGREFIYVIASPSPLAEFETAIASLRLEEDPGKNTCFKKNNEHVARLRGMTELAAFTDGTGVSHGRLFDYAHRLADGSEAARGVMIRSFELLNPAE